MRSALSILAVPVLALGLTACGDDDTKGSDSDKDGGKDPSSYADTPIDQVADDVRGHFGAVVFDTVIPRNVRVSEAPSHGLPVIIYDHACAGSQAYVSLAGELIRRLRERVG